MKLPAYGRLNINEVLRQEQENAFYFISLNLVAFQVILMIGLTIGVSGNVEFCANIENHRNRRSSVEILYQNGIVKDKYSFESRGEISRVVKKLGDRFELPANESLPTSESQMKGNCSRSRQVVVTGARLGDDSKSSDSGEGKTIETAVFVDTALENKFNGQNNGLSELNKLVLTIMNQVQQLFRYSSLKVPIKIKLVSVEHLKEIERRGGQIPDAARGDIDIYLNNFCTWQQLRLEKERRIKWDHAILLSGFDLYKASGGKNHSGVLGLAWVGGMCRANYSCTINEGSNLESAFVIAHEIGHSLGIMHDGQRNNCDPNGFIMSERTGAGKIHWSRCSNNYLNESIAKGNLKCLDSELSPPGDFVHDPSKLRPPGQVYPINEQCKLAFGANYTSFVTKQQPFNAVCRELWCVLGTWAKAAHPALEGSSCGDQDRTCREGKCTKP